MLIQEIKATISSSSISLMMLISYRIVGTGDVMKTCASEGRVGNFDHLIPKDKVKVMGIRSAVSLTHYTCLSQYYW